MVGVPYDCSYAVCMTVDAKRKHGRKRTTRRTPYASVSSRNRRTVLKVIYEYLYGILNSLVDVPPYCGSSSGGDSPCTAGNGLLAGLALPDTDCLTLHGVLNKRQLDSSPVARKTFISCLAAESAGVSRVLRDFHLQNT